MKSFLKSKDSDEKFWGILASLYIFLVYSKGFIGISDTIYRLIMYSFMLISIIFIFKKRKIQNKIFLIWIYILILLNVASMIYATSQNYAISGMNEFLIAILIGICFSQFCCESRVIEKVLKTFKYSGVFISLYSILFLGDQLGQGRFGAKQLGNSNTLSLYLTISLCVIIFDLYRKKKILKNGLFLSMCLYVNLFTGTRKGILILVIFSLILLVFEKNLSKKIKSFIVWGTCIFIMIFIIMTVPEIYDVLGVRLEGLLNIGKTGIETVDKSTEIRVNMIKFGMNLLELNPVLGVGINNFAYHYGFEFLVEGVYSHNNYIELLVNNGFFGAIVYYSIYINLIYKLVFKIKKDELTKFFLGILLVRLIYDFGAVTYMNWLNYTLLSISCCYITLKGKEGEFDNGKNDNRVKFINQ